MMVRSDICQQNYDRCKMLLCRVLNIINVLSTDCARYKFSTEHNGNKKSKMEET